MSISDDKNNYIVSNVEYIAGNKNYIVNALNGYKSVTEWNMDVGPSQRTDSSVFPMTHLKSNKVFASGNGSPTPPCTVK